MTSLSFEELQKAHSAVSARLERAMQAQRKDWSRIGELYAAAQVLYKEIGDHLRSCE